MKKINDILKIFVLIVAFAFSGQAWAWRGAKVKVYSEPSTGGYVYVGTSNSAPSSYSLTSDDATQVDKWAVSSKSWNFYLYASAKSGYTFKGWATSSGTNDVVSTTRTGYSVNVSGNLTDYNTVERWAIFARLAGSKTSGSTINFGDVNVGSNSEWQSITINHAHAKAVSISQSGNDGDFYVASSTSATSEFSSFTSTGEGTKTIYVKFVPQNNGLRTCTLTVSSNNELSSLTYYLSGTGYNEPSITWVDGDGNELTSGETTLSVGDVLRASCSTGQTVSYTNVNSSYFTQGTDDSGNPILTVKEGISGTINNVSVTGNLAKSSSNWYAAFSEDFSLSITNLTPQTIEWTNDIADISDEEIGHTITLNAVAKNAKTGANTGQAITYSMEPNSYMSLSGNVLTINNIGGPVAITATAAGNANYAPTSVTKYATVIDMSHPCATSDGHSNGQFNQGGNHDIYPTLPTSLTFKVRKESGWLWKDLVITQYNSNGTQINQDKKSYGEITDSGTGTDVTITCDPAATTIRFTADGKAKYTYYITSITTTRKTEISVKQGANAVTSLSYSTDPGQSLSKQITVTYYNVPVFLSFKSDEDAKVKGTSLWSLSTSKFGGCGKKGSQNVTVTFRSNAKGIYNDKLYVRNNVGTLLHTIDLSASVTAQEQFLDTWNIANNYNTTDQVSLAAATTVGNTNFTFTATASNPANIVSISNAGVMTFSGSGTATIRAYQPGDAISQEFETTHNITINKVTPSIATNPSVAEIKYKDSFANGLLSGGKATVTLRGVLNTEVAGTFTWTNSGNVADGQGSHNYSVTFTPTNGNMYTPKEFTMPVTISRANGGIAMKDGRSVRVHVQGLNDISNEWKIDLDTVVQSKIEDGNRAGVVSFEVTSANKTYATIDGNNIFSATECGTYTIVARQSQTDYYTAASDEFQIEVVRLKPTITGDNRNMMVDGTLSDAFIFVDAKDIDVNITVQSISNVYKGEQAVISYSYATNTITALNAGVAKIYIEQRSTDYIEYGKSSEYTVVVDKYSNAIVVSGFDYENHEIKADWYDNGITLTANNTDYTNSPIQNEQIEGDESMASFGPQDGAPGYWVVYTAQNTGKVRWRVWQEETYKYAAAVDTFEVNVVLDGTCSCVLHNWSWSESNKQTASQLDAFDFSGYGPYAETISFDIKKNLAAGDMLEYHLYKNNAWTDWIQKSAASTLYYTTVGPDALDGNATAIQFKKSGTYIKTDDPYVNNIVLSRKRWLKLKNSINAADTIATLPKMQRVVDGNAATATFYVDFSTCSNLVKVASDNNNVKFANGLVRDTVSVTATPSVKGFHNKVAVTLYYISDTIEDKTVTITVYTNNENRTLTVPVQTTGLETEIVYIGEDAYPADHADLAAGELFAVREKVSKIVLDGAVITLSGTASEISNNKLNPECGNKEVSVTASFAGDNRHEPATPYAHAIAISQIADQVVLDNASVNLVADKEYNVTGWATAYGSVVYSSSDNSVFRIENNKLITITDGTANLIATSTGDGCAHAAGAADTIEISVIAGYVFNGNSNGEWEQSSNWENGEIPVSGDDNVIIRGNLVIDDTIAVKSLTIEQGANVTLAVTGKLTVGNGNSFTRTAYGNLLIEAGGEVILGDGELDVNDFTIEASIGDKTYAAKSGQLRRSANLNVHRDAYFDLVLDQSGECSYGYYDFSVPFPVDVNGGVVARWENDGSDYNGALRNGTHYAIMAHYEDLRANGQYSWKKFSGVMQPGQCYTITVNNTAPNYRFKKKAGTSIAASEILQLQKTDGTGTEADKGWNALGNGLLAMANLNMESSRKVQLYDHATNTYTNYTAGELTFAIGSAFFIQATGNGSVSLVETNAPRALRAPVRRAAVENEEYRVRLTPAGASRFDDQMFLSAAEDARNSYEIGHDMKKMASASSAKIAQIWCSAYGLELCDVELPMTEGGTYFPLGVYSPKAGEYEISAMEGPADTELWLMYEDMPVWNLSNGSYTIELGKGTTNSYSLMLKQGGHYTPTGSEVVSGDNAQARKLIINDNLYIIRDGIRYDATGKRVD